MSSLSTSHYPNSTQGSVNGEHTYTHTPAKFGGESTFPKSLTCQDDVRDVPMTGIAELLGVLQASVAPRESHHGCLGVVEGGARAVQAVGADGILNHVELLELQKHRVSGT